MWYAVIGTVACVIVGILVGWFTATESDAFDERLLHPFAARIARKLPGTKRTFTLEKQKVVEKVEENPSKESSEKTDDTVVEEVKEVKANTSSVFTSTDSRLFDAYTPTTPLPQRTKL